DTLRAPGWRNWSDAPDLKSGGLWVMRVRVPPPAHGKQPRPALRDLPRARVQEMTVLPPWAQGDELPITRIAAGGRTTPWETGLRACLAARRARPRVEPRARRPRRRFVRKAA